jgi:MYXO-CTERM domain-containing protein
VAEWNEKIGYGSSRGIRGGSWISGADLLAASFRLSISSTLGSGEIGFRVASLVPEPGPGLLGMTAVLGLAASRRRRAS